MVSDLYELLTREYGAGQWRVEEGIIANAGAAPLQFLRQDPRRIAFVFMNLSANALGILPSGNIVAATRQLTVPSGGIAAFNFRDDLVLPGLEWFVLGTAAAEAFLALAVVIDATTGEKA